MTLTCITCRVMFADPDHQREHYKQDWHRYNLKRKVAELPPVTAENFKQRVLAQRSAAAEQEKDKKSNSYCKTCRKNFNSANAFANHLNSKKHKETEIKLKEKEEYNAAKQQSNKQNMVVDTVAEKNALNQALKDSLESKTSIKSSTGPSSSAGPSSSVGPSSSAGPSSSVGPSTSTAMEVDEEEELWEGEALGQEECLFCSKVSKSLDDNVSHMTKKHGFFIPHIEYLTDLDGLIEYLGAKVGEGHVCLWCNESSKQYRSTQAVQQHMVDKGHCKMHFEEDDIFEFTDFYKYDNEEDDAAEDDDNEEMLSEGEDEDNELNDADDGSIYQLVLPSGAVLGHRSLMRYYRQKLSAKQAAEAQKQRSIKNVISQYKALGWTGATGLDVHRRAKDLKFVQRMKNKHNMRIGVKANKLQHHFRPQVVF